MSPHGVRSGWHYINMPIEDERTAFLLAGLQSADHIDRVVVIDGDGRESGMSLDLADIDRPAIHGKTTLLERPKYEVLAGSFLTAQRREPNEVLGECDLTAEP